MPLIVIGTIILVSAFCIIVAKITRDPYQSERGFYAPTNWVYYWSRPRYFRRYHNGGVTKEGKPINPPTSVGSGGHSGGGCACACACAGGGRAGCSMKDFYNTDITTEKLNKALKKDNE